MKNILKYFKIVMILPFTVLVLVPLFILSFSKFDVADLNDVRLYLALAAFFIGASFVVAIVLIFAKDIKNGNINSLKDSPNLMITGPFAYVRNPMTMGVFMIIVGEAFFFGSIWVGVWALCFLAFNQWYLKRVEEPKLAAKFGHSYLEYYRNVPRWFPRTTPWKPRILE